MPKPSKEKEVLELFFNYPSKHWHFFDIVDHANISKPQANHWLKKFTEEKTILHKKPKGKMPYFIANHESTEYRNKKRMHGLNYLNESGLLNALYNSDAKVIIIFGSFSRSDWYNESDIDIFVLGRINEFTYPKVSRELQFHEFEDIKDLKRIKSRLMKNVINGYLVKGDINDLVGAV